MLQPNRTYEPDGLDDTQPMLPPEMSERAYEPKRRTRALPAIEDCNCGATVVISERNEQAREGASHE